MRVIFQCLIPLGVFAVATARAPVLPWPLPPIAGTLSGKTQLSPGSPVLTWQIVTQAPTAGEQSLEISVRGTGLALQTHAHVATATGNGEWRLQDCRIDLSAWSTLLAEKIPTFSGWQLDGSLSVEGRGALQGDFINGALTLTLSDGKLSNSTKKISCEGAKARIVLAGLHPLRTESSHELTISSIKSGSAELHDIKISFAILADGQVRVAGVEAAGFGGKISVEPFSFVPASGTLDFTVQATDLELAQIRAFVDSEQTRVREATGRVGGRLALHFDHDGLRVGQGFIALQAGESARILFQKTPGLFTSYLPANIRGVYTGFEPIELGKLPLVVKGLRVQFYPGGETAERTASIELEGDSADPHLPAPLVLNVNVAGPLQEVLDRYAKLGGTLK